MLLLVASGCGNTGHATTRQAQSYRPSKTCTRAAPAFRTCFLGARNVHPTIERMTAAGWAVVTGPLKHPDPSAQWGRVWLSPDSRTLLAEWQFPCDSEVGVFVPMRGGTARVVTGQLDWRKAPISRPLGWTRDGQARVEVEGKRGVQLIDPRSVRRLPTRPRGC
jgi:hypothetical protein